MSGPVSPGPPGKPPASPVRAAANPPATAAFLRGIERRAAVLAEAQCGDASTGDAAVAAAMRQFSAEAGRLPMGHWPVHFWRALLAQPGLRSQEVGSIGSDPGGVPAELGAGPRAALLLRLVAGLAETEAAAALGVAAPTYRLALQRALRRGEAEPQTWQRLQEQFQHRVKNLPPPRLVRLTRNREAALAGSIPHLPGTGDSGPRGGMRRPRALLPVLWAALGLCALGFAATFWIDGVGGRGAGPQLPPEAPASRYGTEAGLVAHRDFALLADPDGLARARQLAFHSWLVDQELDGTAPLVDTPPVAASVEPPPERIPAAPAVADSAALADFRAILPRLQPEQRARLQQQAARWSGWDETGRRAFATRAARWDGLPPAERGDARERYQAWLALPPLERARVAAAARRHEALPAAQQNELRATFDALDRSERRGWLLGPDLGADYAGLQPLLAQVPASEHADLLRVLRAMTVTQRDDLSVLVQRTPPQERERLRRELVSTAAGNREDWLWSRLHR